MPNIFGRNPRDLSFIASQCDAMNDSQIMDSLRSSGSRINWDHDFSRRNFATDAEANTAGFGLVTNNGEALQAEIEEILHEQFVLPKFVPINTSIPEGAQTFALRVVNRSGRGTFINKDGSNVKTSSASIGKVVFKIEYAGIEPQWTLQELRECLFQGTPLSSEVLRAGAEGAMQHIQDVGFNGDESVGFTGLLNSPDVPVFAGTVPVFDTATEQEIVDFLNNLIAQIGLTSKGLVFDNFGMSDLVIALPMGAFNKITTTKYGSNADRSIAEWFSANNAWTVRTGRQIVFKDLYRLDAAADSGTGRVIVYPNNNRVLEMALPISPRIITTDASSGYVVKAPMEYSMSGTNMKRPTLMIYADGVTTAP